MNNALIIPHALGWSQPLSVAIGSNSSPEFMGPDGPLSLTEMETTPYGVALTALGVTKEYVETLVLSSGLPLIVPPAMTIQTNGAFQLNTPLSLRIRKGYAYYKANAFYPGAPAGMYYVEMSDTANGLVYQNMVVDGEELEPLVKIPFTQISGVINYEPLLSGVDLSSRTIPAGFLGDRGRLKGNILGALSNSAGKIVTLKFKDEFIYSVNIPTGHQSLLWDTYIKNISPTEQSVRNLSGVAPVASDGSQPRYGSQDTTGVVPIRMRVTLAALTDWVVFLSYAFEASKL